MTRRPRPALLLAALVACILVAACSAPAPSPSKALVVGAIYPLSGPQSPGGREELLGVRSALALARKLGVSRARDIDLRVIDAQTPEAARAAVDRLIDSDHAKLIIGTYGSTLSAVAAARADERKTVYWETGAVADEVTLHRHYVFRTVATGSTLGRMAATFTARILMPRDGVQSSAATVVILHTNDTYGMSVAAGEAAEARSLGLGTPADVAYDPHSYDPVKVADEVLAYKPTTSGMSATSTTASPSGTRSAAATRRCVERWARVPLSACRTSRGASAARPWGSSRRTSPTRS